ncbi:FkbM family methyltransferase [Aureispira anguillae]|uniref:FkbM family methyltransferase n=1 Tax=Aureispira anguillae TaxID=2864201 RepID=A0A915YEM0_9BACT|nr:FkbM family methyltransferase [Aureispira anguillae]BDS11581.1 FkbM family methyltransferase [Aureispira anguillae]
MKLSTLIKAEKLVPIRYLRPYVAKILTQDSMTSQGYERACMRLVDPNLISEPLPLSLQPKWWNVDPIVKANRLGLNLTLDLRDNIQRCIYFTGKYEPQTLALIRNELQPNDVFIDVGAHIGIHSLVAAQKLKSLGGGQVIAFEPTNDSQKRIIENSKANHLAISLQKIALGNQSETLSLYGDKNWGVHDAAVRSFFGNGAIIQEVEVHKFDDWIKQSSLNKIDVIKIDAEGAEFDILKGMSNSIQKFEPRCLIFEIKESLLKKANVSHQDILVLMKNLGYQPEQQVCEGNYFFRRISS